MVHGLNLMAHLVLKGVLSSQFGPSCLKVAPRLLGVALLSPVSPVGFGTPLPLRSCCAMDVEVAFNQRFVYGRYLESFR